METKKDILKYYKFVIKCSKCLNWFGSDFKGTVKICPPCDRRIRGLSCLGNYQFRNKREKKNE